uniref:Uncharacterized protein n=1 Tax=Anguilla anguilla TaxID=7936 RepID=A0A0E9QWV5_ANGAN
MSVRLTTESIIITTILEVYIRVTTAFFVIIIILAVPISWSTLSYLYFYFCGACQLG